MLYPLKFQPILKEKIWGGSKLSSLFGKEASSNIGESWEVSGYPGDESVVVNGFLAGKNLNELVGIYMGDLVGKKVFKKFGLSFPLLFKFLDANENLSIQVHPDDETAATRYGSSGKTEMWYVVDADVDAELVVGFENKCSKEEYLTALNCNTVESLLHRVKVSVGDTFFVPAGILHTIGKGVVLAEIQQSCDITYRIYDYNRVDENTGRKRELHIEQAIDVINFESLSDPKVSYVSELGNPIQLVKCDYFTTNRLQFNSTQERNYTEKDSFVVLMCIDGGFELQADDSKIDVVKGESILIPSCVKQVKMTPQIDTTLLEVYID